MDDIAFISLAKNEVLKQEEISKGKEGCMRKLFMFICLMLFLSACSKVNEPNEPNANDGATQDADEESTQDIGTNKKKMHTKHFKRNISSDMPKYDFDIEGYVDFEDQYHPLKITISHNKKILQEIDLNVDGIKREFEISSFLDDFGFRFEDMNFDGYKDFGIIYYMTAGPNTPYLFWTWNPDTELFQENFELEKILSPEFDQKKQLIYSSIRTSVATS
jgi:hypothetical protein